MRTRLRSKEGGQALIMVTIALVAMSGLIGMVVDFGWSYFTRRTAQSAADAAALAAANAALDAVKNGQTTYSSLSGNAVATSCATPFSDSRQSACVYAENNGFSANQINVSADTTSPHPAGVNATYWVTVQISSTIPQLFSAISGNLNATVAAKATAAVIDIVTNFSMVGLNRTNDAQPNFQVAPPAGATPDIVATDPNSALNLALGLSLASSDSSYSGDNQGHMPCAAGGSASGCTQYATTMSRGGLNVNWNASTSLQRQPDGPQFYDPYQGLGQPPLTSKSLSEYGILNGNLDPNAYPCTAGSCPSGVYYAVSSSGTPTGGQVTINSATTLNFGSSSNFGDFVFYGGLDIASQTTLGPGRYVMAGVASASTNVLTIAATTLGGGLSGSDSGRVFILTDPNYPGLQGVAPLPAGMPSLTYGQTSIQWTSVLLNGLTSGKTPALPTDTNGQSAELSDFGPLLFWQDQGFTTVKYTSSGTVDSSCTGSLETPCTRTAPTANPVLSIGSNRSPYLSGVVYQPRGAWLQVQSGGNLQGPLILVTGAVDIGLGGNINKDRAVPTTALRLRRVALVQ